MPDTDRTVRAHALFGREVRDRAGNRLGRVADLVLDSDVRVPARVVSVVVTAGPWGRLLGYISPDDEGPWILAALARWIIQRRVRVFPWNEVVLEGDG